MSQLIDALSHFLARRKGLLPLLACVMILINLLLRLTMPGSWMATTDFLLHLGILTAILGLLLARVL